MENFPRPPIIRYPGVFPIFQIRRSFKISIEVSLIGDNFLENIAIRPH